MSKTVYPFYDFHPSETDDGPPGASSSVFCCYHLLLRNNSARAPLSPVLTVTLSFCQPDGRRALIRNPKLFLDAHNAGQPYAVSSDMIYSPKFQRFEASDLEIFRFLSGIIGVHADFGLAYMKGIKTPKLFDGKAVHLNQDDLIRSLLLLLSRRSFTLDLSSMDASLGSLEIQQIADHSAGPLPVVFRLLRDWDFKRYPLYRLHFDRHQLPLALTSDYRCICCDGRVLFPEPGLADLLGRMMPLLLTYGDAIGLTGEQLPHFMNRVWPTLTAIGQVELEPDLKSQIIDSDLDACIHMERWETGVRLQVEFKYGSSSFDPLVGPAEDCIIIRRTASEHKILALLEGFAAAANAQNPSASIHAAESPAFSAHPNKGVPSPTSGFFSQDPDLLFEFFEMRLPLLQTLAKVYCSEDFLKLKPYIPKITVRLGLEKGSLLAFSFDVSGVSADQLPALFKAIRLKKRYFRLQSGTFLNLDQPELLALFGMAEDLHLSTSDIRKGSALLPAYQSGCIETVLKGNPGWSVTEASDYSRLLTALSDTPPSLPDLPLSPETQLRPYQRQGIAWLLARDGCGMGGILADDMGLGKTLQALAFIELVHRRTSMPALVIAPTSLIYNWQREASRFLPELKVLVVSGSPADRDLLMKDVHGFGLIVTSYTLVRRDIHLYNRITYSTCILDEAQHIKNPLSQTAQTVKTLKAGSRFALTGTPLENHISELWSLFDFILPGYFQPLRGFLGKYEKPVMIKDQYVLNQLKSRLTPFILRRMKRDVLTELPPKIETVSYAGMTLEQKKLYLAYLEDARQRLQKDLASDGFNKSQIRILAYLTRLRQICCHPAMFIEGYSGDSGKLILLMELISDAITCGHKLLVFSQFTSMLSLIRTKLESVGIPYAYLDGAVCALERQRLVDDFNGGDIPVFLISLKAGGTGLNLTAADVVIHVDPWWNPAVEDQATDRAYRIGQKNRVQVIRLITEGTIEEKIDALKHKKRALTDQLIELDEAALMELMGL